MAHRPMPPLTETVVRLDRPLPPLGKCLLGTTLALQRWRIGSAPALNVNEITGREAMVFADLFQAMTFPGIAKGRIG